MNEFDFTLKAQDLIGLKPGDVLIMKYQRSRRIKAGIYGASVIEVDVVRIKGVVTPIVRVTWYSALGTRKPSTGFVILCEDGMIECPVSGLAVEVRFPTEAERKNHLERVLRDELKYGL